MIIMHRIETARAALARAARVRGTAPVYAEDEVIDLLVDIRHLCDAAGIDFARCNYLSRNHYHHETGSAS
ncbi:conserved hypothetical protein [Xanthobacter versatilis]|uniref:Uncharacterized protein n=1 Tax=Xanthobacter autotrophicus (strain ATCC BAA-1158 / Py2) TaxID=78245 RepID=A7ICQ3_XANP2|nr:conserved hypothetical protein [Xanthobacter autotrophicus Py2]